MSGVTWPFAEVQLAYSIAPAAVLEFNIDLNLSWVSSLNEF